MPSVTGGDQVIEAGTIKKEKVNIDFCVWKNRRQVLASLHLLLLPWYICWAMNLFEFVLLRPPSCNATLSTEHRLTLKSLLERQYCLSYHIANQVLLSVLFLIHEHCSTIKDIVNTWVVSIKIGLQKTVGTFGTRRAGTLKHKTMREIIMVNIAQAETGVIFAAETSRNSIQTNIIQVTDSIAWVGCAQCALHCTAHVPLVMFA